MTGAAQHSRTRADDMDSSWAPLRAAALAALLGLSAPGLATAADSLRQQLQDLSATHGFTIKGLGRLDDAGAQSVSGSPRQQLEVLLERYDHVLLGAPPNVERVIIVGRKQPGNGEITVKTTRRGTHHMVEAALEGDGGQRSSLALMVDTGATSMVLPMSMIPALGFDVDALANARTRTAAGPLRGKRARLARVQLGNAVATDVEVLFLPDTQLGETRLLGMSFLKHFGLTIDEKANRLLLTPR